ncbi:hypothetical protein AB6M97_03755 [Streptococcus hillyeri]|uniref:PASTA domain-containing protein n=1 Tax=Streptococcus hillyeri TaxID=2282420 RepID=A0A3L9DXX9_9STRE|nr:hypothetical protein [Streptococcus hillyeri]RLY05138.1 hypothetical protein EAF07_00085 [Streptococcus hillyeri]
MAKKIGKLLGAVGNLLAIPDAIDAVKHVTDKATPIIEKELDRRHEHKKSLIQLDDVQHVPLDYAQKLLENRGFTVLPILAKAHPKYANERPLEVVAMHPRAGNYKPETLVKLYFVNEDIINQSNELKKTTTDNLANLQKNLAKPLDTLKKVKLPLGKKK